jgi:RHS repeat-associated protein
VVNNRGHEVEGCTYDAYGMPVMRAIRTTDVDYNGTVNAIDLGLVQAATDPCTDGPMLDIDGNGTINATDQGLVQSSYGSAIATLYTSGLGNAYFFTGRRMHFFETDFTGLGPEANTPIQYNRARHYDPQHGRWLQRDQLEHIQGTNPYQYVLSNPLVFYDPSGTLGLLEWFADLFTPNCTLVALGTRGAAWPTWTLTGTYVYRKAKIRLPTSGVGEVVAELGGALGRDEIRDLKPVHSVHPGDAGGVPYCACEWSSTQVCESCTRRTCVQCKDEDLVYWKILTDTEYERQYRIGYLRKINATTLYCICGTPPTTRLCSRRGSFRECDRRGLSTDPQKGDDWTAEFIDVD